MFQVQTGSLIFHDYFVKNLVCVSLCMQRQAGVYE